MKHPVQACRRSAKNVIKPLHEKKPSTVLLLNSILIPGFLSHSGLKEKSQKREIQIFFPHRIKYRGRNSTKHSES